MKIIKLLINEIQFDNDFKLIFNHNQDCCEDVYADCENIQAMSHVNTPIYESDFDIDIRLEFVKDVGVHIFNKSGMKYLISCYNIQNGYYSDSLTVSLVKDWGEVPKLDEIH